MAVEEVPQPLKPWVEWVMRGHEEKQCPFLVGSPDRYRCRWPYRLHLKLEETAGSFEQQWYVVSRGWVPLPGNDRQWPQNVKVGDQPALVSQRDGIPSVYLPQGRHRVSGDFSWARLPEALQIPRETGLISLTLNGRTIELPDQDREGRLWLKQRQTGEDAGSVKDTQEVQVYRRIVDEIPMEVATRIEMDVAGHPREIILGPALLGDAIPMGLTSPLPARLEPDGKLRVQVRPGHWAVELVSRHPGPVHSLALAANESPWPEEEVWVFDARNHLRLVRLSGGIAIDPRQTSLPARWKTLPAYRVVPGQSLRMEEERRGDPHPEPDQLSLARNLWLDFGGGGYTLQDEIQGTMSRSWRLEVAPVLKLGRVVVDGEPQFITRREGTQREGVELRRGALNLVADSRIDGGVSRIPVSGWTTDFRQIRAVLHLPPGWRLLTTTGIDEVRSTWVNRWSVFDLFILLIIAAAVGKLWGWHWGGLALVSLALIYHEPGAPRQVWLHILAAVALLRVLPEGRFRRLVGLYCNLGLVALAIIAFPFAVNQVRVALFPQLERPWQAVREMEGAAAGGALMDEAAVRTETPKRLTPREAQPSSRQLSRGRTGVLKSVPGYDLSQAYDPGAVVQTGPGLPRWVWKSVQLVWTGPIVAEQEIRLVLLSPTINLILRILSVALLAILVGRLMNLSARRGAVRFTGAGAALLLMLMASALWPPLARAEMPPDRLLNELRDRLLAKPACLPRCAEIPRMTLEAQGEVLLLRLEIQAMADLAVPLPGRVGQWQAQTVLVGGESVNGLFRDGDGRQWLRLPRGRQLVSLQGVLPALDRVQIDLPLKPHRVEARARGWVVEGLHENGVADDQLQLKREGGNASQAAMRALEPGTLPPFVRVERTLRLGLEWQVETRVVRGSPPGTAVVLEIPLVAGESVTSDGVRVEQGAVLVNMAPEQAQMNWQSVLEKREKIQLTAPETSGWTEVWRVDASPIWHVKPMGLPVVHHQEQGRWLPEWRPWPGESVSLEVSRPEGVSGKTLTVDASSLKLRPGRRGTDSELTLALRSSRGGQHVLTLPEDALLQSVRINNKSQPIRQQGRLVNLPLTPGVQNVNLSWRQPAGIGAGFATPKVDIGVESVNATARVVVPRNRWVLFATGPRLGPAVLFWGLFIVIAMVAPVLGRTAGTPLGTVQWMLLGLGLTQIPVWLAVVVVGWLFALRARQRVGERLTGAALNLTQLGLGALTVAALAVLYYAVKQGLLGWPNMYIAGNGSNADLLQWFQDRAPKDLPPAWVLSVPTLVYRFLMLAWALWLALALLRWLRWGWECFTAGGIWQVGAFTWRRSERRAASPPA